MWATSAFVPVRRTRERSLVRTRSGSRAGDAVGAALVPDVHVEEGAGHVSAAVAPGLPCVGAGPVRVGRIEAGGAASESGELVSMGFVAEGRV